MLCTLYFDINSNGFVKHGSFRDLNACVTRFSCPYIKRVLKRAVLLSSGLSRFPNSHAFISFSKKPNYESNRFPGNPCETEFLCDFSKASLTNQ